MNELKSWLSRGFSRLFRKFLTRLNVRLVNQHSLQALRDAEFSFRDTVENATEGIIRTSREGHFIFSNPAFATLLGYSSPEDLLSSITDVSRQVYVDSAVRKDFLERLSRDKRARCEYQAWKKDGTTTWLSVSSRVVEDEKGRFLYYESIAEDSSERRNRETELANAVGALARSNAELERFAFVVAHDLNEPLRTIRNYVGLLAHAHGAAPLPESKESLEFVSKEAMDFIMQATARMKILIDDILAFSQVDFRSAQTESVDMNAALFNVMANLEAAVKEAGAEIAISPLPPVQAQRAKMERLFQNLISNSIKFRGASPLRISIEAEAHEGRWRFCVRDNGIGFDTKYAEKIFEFFVQLDRRKYSGSGMGLAMCKRIVELYGGKIWAESKVGEGTAISFTLPKSQTADSRQWIKAQGNAEQSGNEKRISKR